MDLITRTINNAIDSLLIVSRRLLDLPLFALIILALAVIFLVQGARAVIAKKRGRPSVALRIRARMAIVLLVAMIFVLDRKIVSIQDDLRAVRDGAKLHAITMTPTKRTTPLFDRPSTIAFVAKEWPKASFGDGIESDAIDHIVISGGGAEAVAIYAAIVDLTLPSLDIRLTRSIGDKTLTSDFAAREKCLVAVNGEAGLSPLSNSGFGHWIGNLIVHADPVLLEDSAERPFLAFDRTNRARYFPASVVDKTVTDEKFNTIWGRFDLVHDGKVVMTETTTNPVTIMGIDAEGKRLFLIVADGRRPGHSLGVPLDQLGRFTRALGATEAMTCDGGGSSCLYLESFHGIVNVPSDGVERPTYTHFGISRR